MKGNHGKNKARPIALLLALGGVFVLAGCDTRPDMPKTKWYKKPVKVLTVDASDVAEVQAAVAVETARKRYYHDLMLLSEYYEKTGNLTKGRWATRELQNLTEAQDFAFAGIVPPPEPPTALPAQPRERRLVENVIDARENYLKQLDELAQFYEKKNDEFKAKMIHTALARFFEEETYLYLHKVEVPPANLEPCKILPRANEMFDRALSLYDEAKRSFLTRDYPKQRQALGIFLRLVRQYPQSTRIASAAYYIGQIYADDFDEPYLALQWYERAWTWDPYLPYPARYEAGVLCQEKLGEKAKALKLLQSCLVHEQPWEANIKDAKKRIQDLTTQLEYAPPPPHTDAGERYPQPAPSEE